MKKCPRCELNYIDDCEDVCCVCYEDIKQSQKPKYNNNLIASHQTTENNINDKVSANEIFQAVRYLTYDYGEYSIYDTDNPMSYRNILKKLQSRFYYARVKYPSKAGFSYVFEAEEIWQNFFLKDEDFKETITHRKIESIDELIGNAFYWHSLPWKRRKV